MTVYLESLPALANTTDALQPDQNSVSQIIVFADCQCHDFVASHSQGRRTTRQRKVAQAAPADSDGSTIFVG